jgi:hypothetical protein
VAVPLRPISWLSLLSGLGDELSPNTAPTLPTASPNEMPRLGQRGLCAAPAGLGVERSGVEGSGLSFSPTLLLSPLGPGPTVGVGVGTGAGVALLDVGADAAKPTHESGEAKPHDVLRGSSATLSRSFFSGGGLLLPKPKPREWRSGLGAGGGCGRATRRAKRKRMRASPSSPEGEAPATMRGRLGETRPAPASPSPSTRASRASRSCASSSSEGCPPSQVCSGHAGPGLKYAASYEKAKRVQ